MPSIKKNLLLEQGTTFSENLIDSNTDFTDYTLYSSFKKNYASVNSYSFVCNGYANGVLTLTYSANSSLSIDYGRYVYDVIGVDSSNSIVRFFEGILTITPKVTTS